MVKYDSNRVGQLAALYVAMARVALFVFCGLGILVAVLGLLLLSGSGPLPVLGAIGLGLGYALAGWLIWMSMQGAAHLMLALVQIESNTRQPEAQAAPAVGTGYAVASAASEPLVARSDGRFLTCPYCGKTNPLESSSCQWCHKPYRRQSEQALQPDASA